MDFNQGNGCVICICESHVSDEHTAVLTRATLLNHSVMNTIGNRLKASAIAHIADTLDDRWGRVSGSPLGYCEQNGMLCSDMLPRFAQKGTVTRL